MKRAILSAALGLAMAAAGAAAAQEAKVTGSAFYRERIALPPNARFEAVIVDASRADAAAPVFARTAIDGPMQPPIRFEISYDAKAVNPAARYAIRATISVDGKLWFTTDRVTPVINGGAQKVELLLRRATTAGESAAPRAALISGEFAYMADAPSFRSCRSGRAMPVAMEGAYKALEETYLAQRPAPGAPLFVTVEGAVATRPAMEGPPRRTLSVSRFLAALPGETCERNMANARLKDTYWKILSLDGAAVPADDKSREPNIVFHGGGRFSATAGCNRMNGGYEAKARALKIGPTASTMMACPPPLAERERALAQALGAARAYAIAGPTLVIYDEARTPLIVMQAVALR
ncbi:MAG: YbaY family lipoprotein [Rhodoblastus sp.]